MTAQYATDGQEWIAFSNRCRQIWESELLVPLGDPYFFDHPLDHVSAMLLVENSLHLAAAVTGGTTDHFVGLRIDFRRFCEFGAAALVRLWADRERPGRWCVEFVQAGAVLGTGTLDRSTRHRPVVATDRSAVPTDLSVASAATAVPAAWVHRQRAENVLIGDFRQVGADGFAARLIEPPPGHFLRREPARFRSLGEIIEAARQFGTALGHRARHVGAGHQFIVRSIEISMARPVPRDEPVQLRSIGLPRNRGRGPGQMTFDLFGTEPVGNVAGPCSGEGHLIGQVEMAGYAISRRDYELFRGRPASGQVR